MNRGVIPVILGFATLWIIAAGCRTEPTLQSSGFSTRNTYSIPPKALLDRVKSAVQANNLSVDSEQDGKLITSWEAHEGAVVGVGSMGRHWQERTRYTITVTPSLDDPTNKGTVEVTEESQQRPHEHHDWGTEALIQRPTRAAEMAQKIDRAIRG